MDGVYVPKPVDYLIPTGNRLGRHSCFSSYNAGAGTVAGIP
jgi:hypothetical protein